MNKVSRWTIQARTYLALGIGNVLAVAAYRLAVRLGLHPAQWLNIKASREPYFAHVSKNEEASDLQAHGYDCLMLFSRWPLTIQHRPPNWLANPMSGQQLTNSQNPWWKIPDFSPEVGDIKLIWELSRMDWALALARQARPNEHVCIERLNAWLADWCSQNPPYLGPNWKCGQEASIRVIHLACAALILKQVDSTLSGLRDLIALHLQRIAPTVQYAMAQDNNHGTTEAAALFIGGSWLRSLGDHRGTSWEAAGRKLLENRANHLIGANGSFSQHSLNYHRLMLDTFSIAEVWRRHLGLPAFSAEWQSSAVAATQWLRHMVNPINGDGPNTGANDGARLLQLTETRYRDYRPSVQLAMTLFTGIRAYAETGPWDQACQWLGIALPRENAPAPGNYIADDGGFAILRRGAAMVMLRYPRFRFRPSQADALHLDLWRGGDNLLRDAGTYSYNTDPRWLNYFGGTESHNTVQFDGRDQMPRLSRFLFGAWLKTDHVSPLSEDKAATHFGAGYRDAHDCRHHRHISLSEFSLSIIDEVEGFEHSAVLRWRLMPGDWNLTQSPNGVSLTLTHDESISLMVTSDARIVRCECVLGWESHHYLEKTELPVLEVEIQKSGKLMTEVHWQP